VTSVVVFHNKKTNGFTHLFLSVFVNYKQPHKQTFCKNYGFDFVVGLNLAMK